MWCGDPTWNDPKFGIPKSVQFRHICGPFSFWSNFGWHKIWVIPCWVTTLDGCHWPQLTNSGGQFQQWSLFTFKQYCLEGILAKESSPRTKDFLLWRDLQIGKTKFAWFWKVAKTYGWYFVEFHLNFFHSLAVGTLKHRFLSQEPPCETFATVNQIDWTLSSEFKEH